MFHMTHDQSPDAGSATYVAYSDETQYNVGRYRGLGMVSLRVEDEARLTGEMRVLLVRRFTLFPG